MYIKNICSIFILFRNSIAHLLLVERIYFFFQFILYPRARNYLGDECSSPKKEVPNEKALK